MKLQGDARGNTGGVDEESMKLQMLPGAIQEQSMRS